jgi:hypothetical protein
MWSRQVTLFRRPLALGIGSLTTRAGVCASHVGGAGQAANQGGIAMIRLFLVTALLLAVSSSAGATPWYTPEYGTVPDRNHVPPSLGCHIEYYDLCSSWVWYWTGYCNGAFADNLPVKYGMWFSPADCGSFCYSFSDLWWATKSFSSYGKIDIELYEATESGGPLGSPLVAVYGYVPDPRTPWQHISPYFGCLPPGRWCAVFTDWTAGVATAPYTECVPMNVATGCADWRCTGHSFILKNVIDYMAYYGVGAPLWMNNAEAGCSLPSGHDVPAGCHESGTYVEFLVDCDLYCFGPSPAEGTSWSGIKAMYR